MRFAAEVGATVGTTVGLVALFGARLLAGAAGGNIATAQAYIADVTTPERPRCSTAIQPG